MRLIGLTPVVVCLALWSLAGPAHALVVSADGQPLSQAWHEAIRAAESTFPQASVNCPNVTVLFTEDGRGNASGWGMWADRKRCEVGSRPGFRLASLDGLCPVVTHEWGHLAGLEHSADPTNIMWPGPTISAWPAACGAQPDPGRFDPKNLPLSNRHTAIAGWFDARNLIRRNRRISCIQHKPACLRRVDRYMRRTARRLRSERAAIERALPWLKQFR